jgi:choline dehydrogenase-like flavoprotein
MANETQYDVVIVGAGIAGAQMAYQFATKGKKVLLLEAGEFIPNVGQEFPVKQNNLDRFYGLAIKDPSVPWPGTKDPSLPWETSDIKAPRPTSPGVNSDNSGNEAWSLQDLNGKPGNYMQQTGAYAFGSTYERVAGGTTKHWLGTCLRFSPDDFIVVSKYKPPIAGAQEWPITYNDLEKYYGMAENEIGVAGDASVDKKYGVPRSSDYPMLPVPQSFLDQVLQQRLAGKSIEGNALDVVSTPQGRNTIVYDNRPACMGNSSCVPICPINAKYDAGVHISKILNDATLSQQVTFITHAVAYQVTVNADDTISGIKYKIWSKGSTQVTEGIAVGKKYVIASHAIETAKLLLNSPWKNGKTVANSSTMVGKNLMDHICLVMWGNLNADDGTGYMPVYPYRGPMSTSGIETFRNTAQRSKTAAFRIEIGNDGWQWPYGGPQFNVGELVKAGKVGTELVSAVQNVVQSQVRFAFELETISCDETLESRVTLSDDTDALGIPRPSVNYKLPQYTLDGYNFAMGVANEFFSPQVANIDNKTKVPAFPGSPGLLTFTPTGSTTPVTIEFRGAGHLIGTHRMGKDSAVSVTDGNLKCWDHSNLYLVGSGAFPTTATSNPTLTIAALALRAVDTIMSEL